MSVELVLNELSHQTYAPNIYTAREWMTTFRETIQAAVQIGTKQILRTGQIFYQIKLTRDYTIAQWLNDSGVDRDERLYIKTLTTKYPYLENFAPIEGVTPVELMDVYYNDQRAEGFRYAYWMDALAISFLSNSQWDRAIIEGLVLQYMEPESDEITEEMICIPHASKPEHVDTHREWISHRVQDSIHDGTDIWYRREELFPALIFCESVRQQLRQIHSSHPLLRQVKERLQELQRYCDHWDSGPFDPSQSLIKGRPRTESQATLQQYGNFRTFLCPDGHRRIFTWHISLNPGSWRLYFFPLESTRKIIIGYIGPHLPIASEN